MPPTGSGSWLALTPGPSGESRARNQARGGVRRQRHPPRAPLAERADAGPTVSRFGVRSEGATQEREEVGGPGLRAVRESVSWGSGPRPCLQWLRPCSAAHRGCRGTVHRHQTPVCVVWPSDTRPCGSACWTPQRGREEAPAFPQPPPHAWHCSLSRESPSIPGCGLPAHLTEEKN